MYHSCQFLLLKTDKKNCVGQGKTRPETSKTSNVLHTHKQDVEERLECFWREAECVAYKLGGDESKWPPLWKSLWIRKNARILI